jgi:hypothetical protein
LMSHGEAWSRTSESLQGSFIESGVGPEAALADNKTKWASQAVEPLSWRILFEKLLDFDVNRLTAMMLPERPMPGSEGHVFELLVALKLLWNAERTRKASPHSASLLLRDLFAGFNVAGLGVCGTWTVSIVYGRNMIATGCESFLHALLSDAELNSLWYNIQHTAAGPDLVFVAQDGSGDRHLVAVQCKNATSDNLSDALKSLHPADQYRGAEGDVQQLYQTLAVQHPWTCKQWVRIVATNRGMSMPLQTWLNKDAAAQSSPIVVASLAHLAKDIAIVKQGPVMNITALARSHLSARELGVE